jgi:hypothetical protein
VNFHALRYTISPRQPENCPFSPKGFVQFINEERVLRQSVSTLLVMCRESMCALYANLMTDYREREKEIKTPPWISVLYYLSFSFTRLL